MKLIDLQLKPEILAHSNIPRPLHGLSPRTINGTEWWNKTRQEVYKKYDYHCIACGIAKALAEPPWLEAHEFYKIDYKKGTMQCLSIEPLCHKCHNFIHSGRLQAILGEEKSKEEVIQILEHGFALLSKAKLQCFPDTLIFANEIGAQTFGVIGYKITDNVPWKQWRLIWNGKEYYSKFKNEEELEEHYSNLKKEDKMPLVRLPRPSAPPTAEKVIKPTSSVSTKVYSLPTKESEPINDLGVYSFLIYGQKKIGKSTLASLFPDTLFFMFEPGAKALRIKRVDINEWEDALGYLSALEKATKKPKTIILDTGFEAHQKCMHYVCKKEHIEYPRENNFGKDWNAIKRELRAFHDRIFALGIGVIVLCHETVKEQQTFTGQKYDQVIPLLAKAADEFYRAVIDNVWWYHYRGKQRFLQIRGTDHAMAGTALQADKFFKTKSGEQINAIPIPSEPMKGMEAIQTAFHNKQEKAYKEETEKFSERVIKESINEKIRKESRKRS